MGDLAQRIAKYQRTQVSEHVLESGVLNKIAQLLVRASQSSKLDLEILRIVGWMYWCRSQCLQHSEAIEEATAAFTALTPVYRANPNLIPGPLRHLMEDQVERGTAHDDLDGSSLWGYLAGSIVSYGEESGDMSLMLAGIELIKTALQTADPFQENRARFLMNLGTALQSLGDFSQELTYYTQARQAYANSIEACRNDANGLANAWNGIGVCLMRVHQAEGDPESLDQAIDAFASSVGIKEAELHPTIARWNLARALGARFNRTNNPQDLRTSIELLTSVSTDTGPLGIRAREALPDALEKERSLSDEHSLARTIQELDEQARSLPSGMALEKLGQARYRLARLTRNLQLLRSAVATLRDALLGDLPKASDDIQLNLAAALLELHGTTKEEANLREAEALLTKANEVPTADSLTLRAIARLRRFESDQTNDLLGAVLSDFARSVDESKDDPIALSGIYEHLWHGYARTNEAELLKAAIRVVRLSVNASTSDTEKHATHIYNLGTFLQSWHHRNRDLESLEEAIQHLRSAVAEFEGDEDRQSQAQLKLGEALLDIYSHSAHPSFVNEAADALAESAKAGPQSSRGRRLSALGQALSHQYDLTGDVRLLYKEASTWEQAALAANQADRPQYLSNLGGALQRLFERTGDMSALNAAVHAMSDAAAAATDLEIRARLLGNLCGALTAAYHSVGQVPLLLSGIEAAREAMESSNSDPTIASASSNLAGALRELYAATRQPEILEEAVHVLRSTVERLRGSGLQEVPGALFNLGSALIDQYDLTHNVAQLSEAIPVLMEALEMAPHESSRLNNYSLHLARALLRRHMINGDQSDYDRGRSLLRRTIDSDTSSEVVKATAAQTWGHLAASRRDWAEAWEAFRASIESWERASARYLTPRERVRFAGGPVASDAAACALEMGSPENALGALERGRGATLSGMLDLHADTQELREAHPELADQFDRIRARLTRWAANDTETGASRSEDDPQLHRGPRPTAIAELHQSDAEWKRMLHRIRKLPGFRDFLSAPSVDTLLAQACDGPVVVINVSRYRCDAIIVTKRGVLHRQLSSVTLETLSSVTAQFYGSIQVIYSRDSSSDNRLSAEETVGKVLGWLWDHIAGPVLDEIGSVEHEWPSDGNGLRVWWIPTGPLCLLPLHAAGKHEQQEERGQSVLDRTVSSYVPTIRTLEHLRKDKGYQQSLSILLVGSAGDADGADLPGALSEVDSIGALFDDKTVLSDRSITRANVLAELPKHSWVHFACHGVSDPYNPALSELVVYGGDVEPLTVGDVLGLDLPLAEVAFLSACSTAYPGETWPDEVVHMTSAFQVAGYRHVIGTLWSIYDWHAVTFAEAIYGELGSGDSLHAARLPYAVAETARRMRDQFPLQPSIWSSYIHSGV
jgi:hypothetical protein